MRPVVVTIVRDRLDHLRRQRTWLAASLLAPAVHVVVVMGGSDPEEVLATVAGPRVVRRDIEVPPDGALPLAAARNVGVVAAREHGGDPIVLLDVDLLPLPGTLGAYVAAARRWPDDLHVGPVRYLARHDRPDPSTSWATAALDPRDPPRHPEPVDRPELLWSVSVALRPATWDALGGFHEGYRGWGAEDTDLGLTAHAAGRCIRWCPDARGLHQWHPVGDDHRRAADLVGNARVFHDRWGWWPAEDRLRALAARGLVAFDPDDGLLELR